MKTEVIYKFYPTNEEIKLLTKCSTFIEMVDMYDIPRSTIKNWKTNGIQLYKLYDYFEVKQVNEWILNTTNLTITDLEKSNQYKSS